MSNPWADRDINKSIVQPQQKEEEKKMHSIALPHPRIVDQQASLLAQHLLHNYDPDQGAGSITYSEQSQVIWTLLQGGFSGQQLGSSVTEVARIWDQAPFVVTDAEDVAKTLVVLNKIGIPKSASGTMQEFQTGSNEGSVSTHCNILLALLHQPSPTEHLVQISEILGHLCTSCWKGAWPIRDERVSGRKEKNAHATEARHNPE